MNIISFICGVGCILYALYEGKPKEGEKSLIGTESGYTPQHGVAFVVGLILIIVSFQ